MDQTSHVNVNMTYNSSAEWHKHYDQYDHYGNFLYEVMAPSLFGFVSVTGVAGNSLVVYVICTKHKLRSVTNMLLLNLAFADLLFVLICPPFTAYQNATFHWPFEGVLGDVLCKLMHYLLNVTAYVTIYTLVLIAALRYATVVHNDMNNRCKSKVFMAALVAGMWVLMLLVNIPILTSYGMQKNIYGLPDCDHYGTHVSQALYVSFFVFAYLLPLGIIVCFYTAIQRSFSSGVYMHDTERSQQQKKYASRLIIAVIVMFAVCWLPIQIHLVLAYYITLPDSKFYRTMAVLFNFLAYFNSCINPIIYNCTSKDFRESFREAICCGHVDAESSSNVSQAMVTFRGQSSEVMMHEEQATARTSLRSDRLNIDELSSLQSNNSSFHRDNDVTPGNHVHHDTADISISAYEDESDIHSAMV